jgi:UDP-N-acetyl-D-mannosaminuronate dehydrogenase
VRRLRVLVEIEAPDPPGAGPELARKGQDRVRRARAVRNEERDELSGADLVVLITAHADFDLGAVNELGPPVVDFRGVMRDVAVSA